MWHGKHIEIIGDGMSAECETGKPHPDYIYSTKDCLKATKTYSDQQYVLMNGRQTESGIPVGTIIGTFIGIVVALSLLTFAAMFARFKY